MRKKRESFSLLAGQYLGKVFMVIAIVALINIVLIILQVSILVLIDYIKHL